MKRKEDSKYFKECVPLVAEIIKENRKAMNLTQEGLADILGVTSNTISRIERGKVSMKLVTGMHLAEIFDLPLEFMLFAKPLEYTEEMRNLEQKAIIFFDDDRKYFSAGLVTAFNDKTYTFNLRVAVIEECAINKTGEPCPWPKDINKLADTLPNIIQQDINSQQLKYFLTKNIIMVDYKSKFFVLGRVTHINEDGTILVKAEQGTFF